MKTVCIVSSHNCAEDLGVNSVFDTLEKALEYMKEQERLNPDDTYTVQCWAVK